MGVKNWINWSSKRMDWIKKEALGINSDVKAIRFADENLHFDDNIKLRFGTGDGTAEGYDHELYWDGSTFQQDIVDAGGLITATTLEGALAEAFQHIQSAQAFLPVPLTTLREVASDQIAQTYDTKIIDVPLESLRETDATNLVDITDTPKTDPNIGSLLGKSTTPILDMVNGDTDSDLRVQWASSNNQAVIFKVYLEDIDVASDLTITLRAKMGGATDTPTVASDVYFNEGDTKVEDVSAALSSSIADAAITVAAADIPAGAEYMTVELTPGAHTTDTLDLHGIRVSYTAVTENFSRGVLGVSTTPVLGYTNGDTDSALRVRWAASNNDPVVFQTPLPPDLDTSAAVVLHARIASGGTTDAVGFTLDTYFNEGDTKVEDTTGTNQTTTYSEVTATVAAADVPTGAQTMTCELTPAAHTTDTLDLTALWIEYTRKTLIS